MTASTRSPNGAVSGELLGDQRPRIAVVPDGAGSAGVEAIELAATAGLHLDDWEAWSLDCALRERPDGKWAAWEVGTTVSRQNGKGSILEARELAGAMLFGEKLLIHSAHEQATSSEHHRRLVSLVEEADLQRRIRRIVWGKGSEAIEFKDGTRILFKTRTGGGGRGFTGDFVALDEAMILAEYFMGALVPTMAARSRVGNPQLWYAGSAVDRQNPKHDGVVFSRLRHRALRGDDRIAYLEWSLDAGSPDEVSGETLADPKAWAQANPGLGIRISDEYVASELGALAARTFCVERLCVGDWEKIDVADDGQVITVAAWNALEDAESRIEGPVCFSVDVSPSRGHTAIAVAGFREDSRPHVEVAEHRAGTGWVVDRMVALVAAHECGAVQIAARSPAASLIQPLRDANVDVEEVSTSEHAEACGAFFDAVDQGHLRHGPDPRLTAAIRAAVKRPLGDAWLWSRKESAADITPLVSCTLALRGAELMDTYQGPLLAVFGR